MGFDRREVAKVATPRDGDGLDDIAAREQAAGNDITAEQIAKFNWGTEKQDEINEFLRDEMGTRKRDSRKNFLFADDDTRRSQLLVPKKFEKDGLPTGKVHALRVKAKSAPPQFIECCSVPGITFEFDKSFIRPSVVDALKQLEDAMGRNPDAKIMIWGHTDKVGSEQYNKLLSERRAKSVFAFITNDVPTWEQLADHPNEHWGKNENNQMLADQGFDPATNPNAVKDYQTARGLNPDGIVGPITRRQLFTDYMSGIHDLKLTSDQFMPPKHMGCGEFNPQIDTEAAEERNRRVTFFLFNKDRLPKLPCPTVDGDIAPCKKQQVSLDKRHIPSFKCSFFDSIAFKCQCENPNPPPPPPPPVTLTVIVDGKTLRSVGKKATLTATGTPPGGTFSWKVTTGAGALSSSSGATVDLTSGTVGKVTVTVTYKKDGSSATATHDVTFYKVKQILAESKNTRCRRAAAGTVKKTSITDNKTFAATTPTYVRGCGDVALVATADPPDVTITWIAQRAADDDPGLAGEPALDAGASDRERTLKTDKDVAGSFHIIAFVDEDGDGKRAADEGAIQFNINLVKVDIAAGAGSNQIITRNTLFRDTRSTANTLIVDSGSTGGIAPGVNAKYTDAEFLKHPLAMKMTVLVTGGGANRLRGVDKVGLGYIQQTPADSFVGTYADGRTLQEKIFAAPLPADPVTGGAPALLAFPVRDTRGNSSRNTGPYIISSSDADKSKPAGGGEQRIVRYVDPPAIVLARRHPVTNSPLASIGGTNDFEVFLSAFSKDFDQNYAVISSASWKASYGTFTAAAGWSNVGAAITTTASMAVNDPPKPGDDTDVERCPPNFVDNLRMDAR